MLPPCLPCLTLDATTSRRIFLSSFRFIVHDALLFEDMPCFDLISLGSWQGLDSTLSTFCTCIWRAIHALRGFQLLQRRECGASGDYGSGVTPFRSCISRANHESEAIIILTTSGASQDRTRSNLESPSTLLILGPNFNMTGARIGAR